MPSVKRLRLEDVTDSISDSADSDTRDATIADVLEGLVDSALTTVETAANLLLHPSDEAELSADTAVDAPDDATVDTTTAADDSTADAAAPCETTPRRGGCAAPALSPVATGSDGGAGGLDPYELTPGAPNGLVTDAVDSAAWDAVSYPGPSMVVLNDTEVAGMICRDMAPAKALHGMMSDRLDRKILRGEVDAEKALLEDKEQVSKQALLEDVSSEDESEIPDVSTF